MISCVRPACCGTQNERAEQVMKDIYRPLSLREFSIMSTDLDKRRE